MKNRNKAMPWARRGLMRLAAQVVCALGKDINQSPEIKRQKPKKLCGKGFVPKQVSAPVLYEAIREIQKGNIYFCPEIGKRRYKRDHNPLVRFGLPRPRKADLTSRETEVLQLIAEGHPNKVTAAELGISSKTVEMHRQHLKEKLGILDTAGLTRYAIGAGIIEGSIQFIVA